VQLYHNPKPSVRPAGFLAVIVGEYATSLFFPHGAHIVALPCDIGFRRHHVANPDQICCGMVAAAVGSWSASRFIFDHPDLVPELIQVRNMRASVPVAEPDHCCGWNASSMRLADQVISTNETFSPGCDHPRRTRSWRDVTIVRNGPWLAKDLPGGAAGTLSVRSLGKVVVGYNRGIMNSQESCR
jgi:hypothetical protein